VLVPEEPTDRLLQLRLPGASFTQTRVGVQPHAAVADGDRIFVGNEFGRGLSVIQGAKVVANIGGFVQPGGITAVGASIAVVDVRRNDVTLIDARTLKRIASLPAGAGPTHAAAGAGSTLYVIDTRGDAVDAFTARPTLKRTGKLRLRGTPYGVAIDAQRHRLWVTMTATNQLAEISIADSSRPSVIATYPTARQPNTVAIDPTTGRVFVADAGAGVVQIIDPR
jgi:YVTN family beta-propeller protein